METDRELAAVSALNRIYGSTPRKGLALLEKYGTAAAVPGLPLSGEAEQLEQLAAQGTRLVSCLSPDYPPLLKETPDHPVGLYVTGTPGRVFTRRAVAIVGTRDITSYGVQWCRRIVRALAETAEKPLIVSGFAIGTDIIAQAEALSCGLPTVGVMPCGPERIYPARHETIAQRLFATPGCALVSDYPPGTPVMAANFLRRNRIIAALADAVILIESKRKGGGLITMNYAVDYGRGTYALPGRAGDPCSEGCNLLIRRNKAEIITDTDSLLESLGLGVLLRHPQESGLEKAARTFGPDSTAFRILQRIRRSGSASADELCREMNLPYSSIIDTLTALQTGGWVESDLLQRFFLKS